MKSAIQRKALRQDLPLVPLRELVVFPHMVVPFFVGRPGSLHAVEEAMNGDRMVFLACQTTDSETPSEDEIYATGTVSKILQMLKLPDGKVRILAEGKERAVIQRFVKRGDFFHAELKSIPESETAGPATSTLMSSVHEAFKRYSKYQKKISPEALSAIEKAETPEKLADLISANLPMKTEKKIELLGIEAVDDRLEALLVTVESETELLSLQNRINTKVRKRMEKSQKDYFLNEQLKEINRELGREESDATGAGELERSLKEKKLPAEVLEKALKECKRLSKLQPMSPEAGVLRTYLEWIVELPWEELGADNRDIDLAARILDEDHYDMKKPKERILDFIAVRQLKERVKGPIICLVGPPGTGKTSLGKSVARALGREFVRVSLGGVRDEAEIRGHRKTYVGALPGKIIQSMKKVGTANPVFLLDEVDKISSDFRGDPASALLEVLDPEQNHTFVDHYLEVPYDLSAVMFIATANSMYNIPYALRDRMEIIEIPGYTDLEKVRIASEFIIPKQLKENGLECADVRFQKAAVLELIHGYTMESGVRNLEREIAAVIRKIAREAIKKGYRPTDATQGATGEKEAAKACFTSVVTQTRIAKLLGPARFQGDLVYKDSRPGLAHGLAWTEIGGTLLPVEVAILDGPGDLILTGSLGDVMKESARTALSFLKVHYRRLGLRADFSYEKDIHIHVPEGAIPKDGPSAGITLAAALLSAFTGTPVRQGYAMTGEITLTGRILPIGGVKEKVLAAYRNKMTTVVMPEGNRKDIDELPKEVRSAMKFHFSDSALETLLTLVR